jgi:hypothetical protein
MYTEIVLLAWLIIILLIVVASLMARRMALKCPKCRLTDVARATGKNQSLNHPRRIPFVSSVQYRSEYLCLNCGHHFWSAVHGAWTYLPKPKGPDA